MFLQGASDRLTTTPMSTREGEHRRAKITGAAQKGPGYEVEFREISCKFERENGVNMSSGVYVFPAY